MGESGAVSSNPLPEAPPAKGTSLAKLIARRMLIWLLVDLALVGAFIASYVAISTTPLPRSSIDALISKYEQLRGLVKGLEGIPLPLLIFMNNAIVTLAAYIPFIGVAFFASTMYWTARVLQLVAVVTSCTLGVSRELVSISYALLLLVTPHTYLEFFAYAIALFQNARLCYLLVKRRWSEVRQEVRIYLASIPIALAFLLLGAYVEASLISMFTKATPAYSLPPPEKLHQVLQTCLHNA